MRRRAQCRSRLVRCCEWKRHIWTSGGLRTDTIRATAASIIAEYDGKVAAAVEATRKELLTLSLAAYKERAKQKLDADTKQLQPPVDASQIDALFDSANTQWSEVVATFTSLDAAAQSPYDSELKSHITERRQHWQSENMRESVRMCTEAASKLGRRLSRESERLDVRCPLPKCVRSQSIGRQYATRAFLCRARCQ